MLRRTYLIALTSITALAIATPVAAARGGSGGGTTTQSSSSISLDQIAPSHGDAITFTVTTNATDRPFSQVDCYRNGTLVYSSSRGHFQDYYDYFGDPIHYLSSSAWPSGAADCTGSLVYQGKNGRWRTLTSMSFHVSA